MLLVKEVAARWGTVEAVGGRGDDAGDGHGDWRAPPELVGGSAQPRRLGVKVPDVQVLEAGEESRRGSRRRRRRSAVVRLGRGGGERKRGEAKGCCCCVCFASGAEGEWACE